MASEHLPVTVTLDSILLEGDLRVPIGAAGAVLFAHGSGSSRHSPRNRYVADVLNHAGLATLLIDLLTEGEQLSDLKTGHLRFDIPFLTKRLVSVAHWLGRRPELAGLNVGIFGASTGAAAALMTAAVLPNLIHAVVSRGGRPDLAGDALAGVLAPTLLIVGGADAVVLDLNRKALSGLPCGKEMRIVPGGGHLFEEPGALETVAALARDWFVTHLTDLSKPAHDRAI